VRKCRGWRRIGIVIGRNINRLHDVIEPRLVEVIRS
jgi:hypothetical protein